MRRRIRDGWTAIGLAALLAVSAAPAASAVAPPVTMTTDSHETYFRPVPVSDTATLGGGDNPTGTIAFALFGPNNPTCDGPPIFLSVVSVSGPGTYTSAPFTPATGGTYRWIATYSGDPQNNGVSGVCGDPTETFFVYTIIVDYFLTAQASPSVAVGGQITDTARLLGADHPTGTVVFVLFGPDDATCATPPIFTSAAVSASDDGTFTSSPFTPTTPGTYWWRATYSGDENIGSQSTSCHNPAEAVSVTQAQPSITTTATASARLGEPIHDRATLAGGFDPTGTITFDAFRPGDFACGGPPAFTAAVAVVGNGDYESPGFTPTVPGTYRWTAAYSGDNANAAATSPCGAANESSVVSLVPAPICQLLRWFAARVPFLQQLIVAFGC